MKNLTVKDLLTFIEVNSIPLDATLSIGADCTSFFCFDICYCKSNKELEFLDFSEYCSDSNFVFFNGGLGEEKN